MQFMDYINIFFAPIGAKEEVRRLMSVLLQRESKYSHEIRRAEQENAKLKERLLKVINFSLV